MSELYFMYKIAKDDNSTARNIATGALGAGALGAGAYAAKNALDAHRLRKSVANLPGRWARIGAAVRGVPSAALGAVTGGTLFNTLADVRGFSRGKQLAATALGAGIAGVPAALGGAAQGAIEGGLAGLLGKAVVNRKANHLVSRATKAGLAAGALGLGALAANKYLDN